MNPKTRKAVLITTGGLLAIVAFALVLRSLARPVDPNVEIARALRDSMRDARTAREALDAVRSRAGRVRLLVLGAGVAGSLALAWIIWRGATRADIEPEDILDILEKEQLLPPAFFHTRQLDAGEGESLLTAGREEDDPPEEPEREPP